MRVHKLSLLSPVPQGPRRLTVQGYCNPIISKSLCAAYSMDEISWLGPPDQSVGVFVGWHDNETVWHVKEKSPAALVYETLKEELEASLKECSLAPRGEPTPEMVGFRPFCRLFMVGEQPEIAKPTILINTQGKASGLRWRARAVFNSRRLFQRYPGLEYGEYWPSPISAATSPPPSGPLPSIPVSSYAPSVVPSEMPTQGATIFSDSGYGSSSNTTAVKRQELTVLEDIDEDMASVITDNLSLDLPSKLEDTYVTAFAEHIFQAMNVQQTDQQPYEKMVQDLPDLLRAFAVRVAFTHKSSEAKAIGTFTRQKKE
jgi:hypothetical protein